jgi:acetoin utilization deacetylase AcuC-like enzyme
MPIAFISHHDCMLHDMGAEHPEQPARLSAINDRLIASGLQFTLHHFDAPLAERQHLLRVHDPQYLDYIHAKAPDEFADHVWLDADTLMCPHSLQAALRAAGAGVMAVDLVMGGRTRAAFCAVRPPGHHAERRQAMGFCIFNNIAVAAAHALETHGLERVAIIDFDVHHGNGTEDIFRDDPRVLFCSSFQHPFYPYSGADTVSDHIVNIPLAAGTAGEEFRRQVQERWLPALRDFAPQLVLVSAGFDGHAEDHLAYLRLREPDYAWVTDQLKAIADEFANGRVVSMLEGGYALSALGRSVAAHIDALLGHVVGP